MNLYLPATYLLSRLPEIAVYLDGAFVRCYTVYFHPMPTRMEDLPWTSEHLTETYRLRRVTGYPNRSVRFTPLFLLRRNGMIIT
jgi:hypothetical protein